MTNSIRTGCDGFLTFRNELVAIVQSPQQVCSDMLRMNLTLNEYFSSYGLQYSHVDSRPRFYLQPNFNHSNHYG